MELRGQLSVDSIDQYVVQFFGRLFDDRTNGALIRVNTHLPEHEGSFCIARSQLLSFATSADDLLDTHWPEEVPNVASV